MTQMKQEQEIMGMVTDIQRFSVHDGPGIRTTVFLKGCNCLLYTSFPSNPTFENFVNIFTNTNFPRYLLNSFIVAIVAMVLCTVFAATAGYVIARKSTFFFRSYGVTLLLLQMFPTILLLCLLYTSCRRVRWRP